MKTKVKIILTSCFLVVCFALTIAAVLRSRSGVNQAEWTFETESPTRQVNVRFTGHTAPPSRVYYVHGTSTVTYSVTRIGTETLKDVGLYKGNEYDDLFLDLYPMHEWVSDETLRLGVKISREQEKDTIRILNNSSRRIDVLETRFGNSEIFISFDLTPGQEIRLLGVSQNDRRHDTAGLRCVLRDGDKILQQAAAFNLKGGPAGTSTYSIRIEDSGISIENNRLTPLHPN